MCRWRANSTALDFLLSQFGLYFLRHLPQITTATPTESQNRRPSGPHGQLKSPAMTRLHCQSLAVCSTAELGFLLWVRMTIQSQPEETAFPLPVTTGVQRQEHCGGFHVGIISLAACFMSRDSTAQAVLCTVQGLVLLVPPQLDWIKTRGTREKSNHVGN